MCHLEGKKDMYEKGIFRNAKHRIIQPIILRSLPTSRMSTLNSQYSLFTHSPMVSTIPNVHLVTFDVTVLCTILTIFVILLLVVSLIWYIKSRIRRKTFRHADRSEPEIHGQSINESFELLESANASVLENQINPETQNLVSSCHCTNCQIMSSLPKPMSEMPDMLFPRCCTDIDGTLGHGNFGSVFKGSLKMGNARSVLQFPFSQ